MTALTIQADEQLIAALQTLAAQEASTVEDLAREALTEYIQTHHRTPEQRYSFIGIGRSGQKDLSLRAEEILEQAADRREGWSLK